MRTVILSFFCLLLFVNGLTQTDMKVTEKPCSKVLSEVSYFWKLDSLGQNGYRLCNYKRILNSTLDSITLDFLFSKLGKPNFIVNDNTGVYYSYYYFNGRIIPQNEGFSEELMRITFKVKKACSIVNSIMEGAEDD